MKNIIVAGLTALIIGLMIFTAIDDPVYQGGEHAKVIKDFGSTTSNITAVAETPKEKTDRDKENDKIKALREKAGNIAEFKVSAEYKSKCSSCHGADGSGMQNGRKMMGPKIFGQSEEKLYKDLADFKAGRKENMVIC